MSGHRAVIGVVVGVVLAFPVAVAFAQVPEEAGPPPPRVRIILNGAFWPTDAPSFTGVRTFEEYVEQTTLRTSYETDSTFGPEGGLQVSLFGGVGVLASYSLASRDTTGSVDVSRPHPLYFDRPRTASAEITGYDYRESAINLDLAYGRGAGHLDWSIFGGVTLFRVEADLLAEPTFTDVYPYQELAIASTPATSVESNPTGFNVGGRLDYRFGQSGHFGLGVQVLYSRATAELQATPDSDTISVDVGGLQLGAGLRLYF
jgi:hypothetical protein